VARNSGLHRKLHISVRSVRTISEPSPRVAPLENQKFGPEIYFPHWNFWGNRTLEFPFGEKKSRQYFEGLSPTTNATRVKPQHKDTHPKHDYTSYTSSLGPRRQHEVYLFNPT
jgi:hypothetical protein